MSLFVAFDIALNSDPGPVREWKIAALFAVAAVCTIAVYFLNRWYIHKLYGRHVRKLQELLREMDEV